MKKRPVSFRISEDLAKEIYREMGDTGATFSETINNRLQLAQETIEEYDPDLDEIENDDEDEDDEDDDE